jgi:hypothetical protein
MHRPYTGPGAHTTGRGGANINEYISHIIFHTIYKNSCFLFKISDPLKSQFLNHCINFAFVKVDGCLQFPVYQESNGTVRVKVSFF